MRSNIILALAANPSKIHAGLSIRAVPVIGEEGAQIRIALALSTEVAIAIDPVNSLAEVDMVRGVFELRPASSL